MRRKELLQELYDRSMNRILAMSANYLMTIPKKGMVEEFIHEKEIAQFLKTLIEHATEDS